MFGPQPVSQRTQRAIVSLPVGNTWWGITSGYPHECDLLNIRGGSGRKDGMLWPPRMRQKYFQLLEFFATREQFMFEGWGIWGSMVPNLASHTASSRVGHIRSSRQHHSLTRLEFAPTVCRMYSTMRMEKYFRPSTTISSDTGPSFYSRSSRARRLAQWPRQPAMRSFGIGRERGADSSTYVGDTTE